ncbi:kinetochore-associated protein 1 [Ixodes scapularis]
MWNAVCFNLGGETVNFGPRNELLGGSELYEACTLFTIGIGAGVNSVSHQPPVHAFTTSGYFAIAIENVVNVMRHQTTVLSRTFESTVDCIALRSDVASGVLLAGERLGILHVVLVESSKVVSFRVGKTPSDGDTKLFRSIEVRKADEDDVYNVFVLAGDNMIVATISDEILSQLNAATKEPDLTLLQVRVVNLGQKISAKDTMFPSTAARWVDDDLLVSSSPSDLYCFSIGEKRSYRLLSGLSRTGVSKMFAVQSDCSLLVLNAEKELLVLCLKTLIIKRTWSEMGIDDFMVSEDAALSCEAGTDQGLKIALLTALNEDAPRKLKICRYSTLELLYSLEVEEFCWLATVGHDQEDFCIVEGTAEKDWGGIAELRVRVVSEALPEQRLAKLIGKQKFLEAEEFARLYKLPLEEVHWNHLLFVLDELGGLRQSPLDETSERARLEEAYSLIRQLPDALRVARCCVETQIATPSAVVGLFLFLQEHLSATECPDCAERDALCAEITSLLNRVTTYRLLQSSQTTGGWLSFSRADLLQEMSSCFRNEDVPSALLIWARHQDQFIAHLDCEATLFLLNAIPSTIRVSVLVGWLEESFLPCILQNVPEAVQGVCLWIVSRALSIELNEKAAWPSGAVNLLEVVPNVYNQMTSCADILPPKSWLAVYSAPRMIQREESALCKLYYLLTNLRDLELLWTKYKCRVTLPELQNPNILEAVFSILDEVVTKTEVDVLLEGFLLPYLKRKELDVSETLSNYVERTLRYHEIPLLQEAPWEEKVLAVAKFVHHPNHWLKIAVKILSHAPVPWSKGIEELAEQGSLLQGHAIEEIETERKRMQVNVILQRYDMKFLRCTQLSDARVLIRNILLSEKPMALEDALTVAKSMGNLTELEVCLFHMERLLLKGDIDKFADALHSVPPDTLKELGPRMATFGRLHLSRNFASCGGKAKELMECWQYLLTVLYTKQEIKLEDYSSMQNQVLQIITLWRDYEIKIPIANLESAGGRHGRLEFLLCTQAEEDFLQDHPLSKTLTDAAIVLEALPKASALKAVKKALAKVNSYCYEVLQFGYDYLDGCRNREEPTSSVQRELYVLQFLASYRRHGSPSEHEMDVWYDEHPLVDLPAVSRTRLPFHLLLQPSSWKFINNEIHPDTAGAWMDVADILRLDKDDILFMAVENAVVLWSCQKHGGSILDVNFLVSIKSLLDQMSSLDKFLACLGMMLKKLAKGPTAVRAAKTCADLPLSRLGQNSKEAKDRKAKFTRLYMQLRNEQILKHHGIDTSPYLGLCSKTEQLLEKLLECNAWHSLFADTSHIYSCLSQIAESYAPGSLMFPTIVERKIEKWLQRCAPESPLDQTFQTLTFETSSRNDREDSADLIAFIHLIQYIPQRLEDLLNKILSAGNNPLGLQRQVLARKCLLAGFGDSTDRCTAISIGELRMNSYRAMLQRLGVPLDIQELNQQSATELATSLLGADCRSQEILRVVSALCIEFNIQLPSIWDALLSSATKLNAVEVLCRALPTAGRFPLLWQSSEFMSAWRCVLLAPSHLYEVSGKKNKLLQASLALRCPSVHRLPFTLMVDDCRDEGGIVLFVVYTLLRGLGDVTQQVDELFGSLPTEAFTILQAHKDHFFMNLLHIGKVLEK